LSELLRCELCGFRSHHEVKERPVEWTPAVVDGAGVKPWDTVFRCLDYQACRARVEGAGKPWPVRDVVTRPTLPAPRVYEEVPI
jgi:hypothetical protein